MGVFEMVLGIVAIASAAGILESWMKHRKAIAQARAEEARALAGGAPGGMSGLAAEVDRLKERVAVLEKLATDPAHRLAVEIEGLRLADQRPDGPTA